MTTQNRREDFVEEMITKAVIVTAYTGTIMASKLHEKPRRYFT